MQILGAGQADSISVTHFVDKKTPAGTVPAGVFLLYG